MLCDKLGRPQPSEYPNMSLLQRDLLAGVAGGQWGRVDGIEYIAQRCGYCGQDLDSLFGKLGCLIAI